MNRYFFVLLMIFLSGIGMTFDFIFTSIGVALKLHAHSVLGALFCYAFGLFCTIMLAGVNVLWEDRKRLGFFIGLGFVAVALCISFASIIITLGTYIAGDYSVESAVSKGLLYSDGWAKSDFVTTIMAISVLIVCLISPISFSYFLREHVFHIRQKNKTEMEAERAEEEEA